MTSHERTTSFRQPEEMATLMMDLVERFRPMVDDPEDGDAPLKRFSGRDAYMKGLEDALSSRHWSMNKTSPAWRAVLSPATPLDKAFQIHTLAMLSHRNYQPPLILSKKDHQREVQAIEAGLDVARRYCLRTMPEFSKLKADGVSLNGLKIVLEVAFSHDIPPGGEDYFPKYRKRLTEEQNRMAHVLTWNGLLLYINAHPETQSHNPERYKPLADHGTLASILDDVERVWSPKDDLCSDFNLASSALTPKAKKKVAHPREPVPSDGIGVTPDLFG